MKIGNDKPVGRPAQTRVGSRDAARAYQSTEASTTRAPADSATILGVPEAELTPKVREAIMVLMQEVETLRRELDRTHERLNQMEKLADLDTLAPIANRRAFVRELTRAISFAERYQTPSSLIYFDVNGFKSINDNYGHAAGDKALLHVASILLERVRESDVVGRLGGDEFGVILSQTDRQGAREKAVQLGEAIENEPVSWEGTQLPLRLAYGITTFQGGESVTDTLAAADREMYERKASMKAEH